MRMRGVSPGIERAEMWGRNPQRRKGVGDYELLPEARGEAVDVGGSI